MKKRMDSNRMRDFAKFSQSDSKLVFSPLSEEVQNFTSNALSAADDDSLGAVFDSDRGLLFWW